MKLFRLGFLLLVVCLIALLAGCAKPVPVSIKVTGTGAAQFASDESTPPSAPQTPPAPEMSWAEGDVVAIGHGVPSHNAMSQNQARLMAKQAAKLDALRNLAEQVQGVKVSSETTVRNFMTENDEIRSQIESFIAGAEVVSEQELDDGSWEVKMRLNLHPLSRIIRPAGADEPAPAPSRPDMGPMSPAQSRLMAERAAKLDAYRQLLEHLKGVSINSTTTVEDFMAKDDRIRARVEGIVRGARVVDRRFNSDGTVEVDMVLESPDIRQVVR